MKQPNIFLQQDSPSYWKNKVTPVWLENTDQIDMIAEVELDKQLEILEHEEIIKGGPLPPSYEPVYTPSTRDDFFHWFQTAAVYKEINVIGDPPLQGTCKQSITCHCLQFCANGISLLGSESMFSLESRNSSTYQFFNNSLSVTHPVISFSYSNVSSLRFLFHT